MEEDRSSIKPNRISKVVSFQKKIELIEYWYSFINSKERIEVITTQIKLRCNDINKQEAFAKINTMTSLKFYIKIKNYLGIRVLRQSKVEQGKIRISLVETRQSIWKLRGTKKNFDKDMCPLCIKQKMLTIQFQNAQRQKS